MRSEFRNLLLHQLDRRLEPYRAARKVLPPAKGWIRAIRQALGVSSGELARRLGTSRQLPLQLEKAEAEDRITLKSLRAMAHALDCELVYALVPRADTLHALAEDRARAEAKQRVLGVEHSMALENQASGGLDQAIEAETRRLLHKRSLEKRIPK
jgi:predicted DNA-binding mobile mystery protein A